MPSSPLATSFCSTPAIIETARMSATPRNTAASDKTDRSREIDRRRRIVVPLHQQQNVCREGGERGEAAENADSEKGAEVIADRPKQRHRSDQKPHDEAAEHVDDQRAVGKAVKAKQVPGSDAGEIARARANGAARRDAEKCCHGLLPPFVLRNAAQRSSRSFTCRLIAIGRRLIEVLTLHAVRKIVLAGEGLGLVMVVGIAAAIAFVFHQLGGRVENMFRRQQRAAFLGRA